jgi:hypothetical protein
VVRLKPPGRSHDPASNDGARGMVVALRGREESRSCGRQNSAYSSAAAEPLVSNGRGLWIYDSPQPIAINASRPM